MTAATTPEDRAINDGAPAVRGIFRAGTPEYAAAAPKVRQAPTYPTPDIATGVAVGRWGAADVITLPNAWAMLDFLRLALNPLGPFGIKQ